MHCTQSLADLGHVPLQGHPFSRPHMEESVQHQTQSRGKLQPLIPGLRVHPGPFLGTVPLYIYRTFYCSSQGAFRIKRLRPKHQQSSSSFLVSVFTFFLGGLASLFAAEILKKTHAYVDMHQKAVHALRVHEAGMHCQQGTSSAPFWCASCSSARTAWICHTCGTPRPMHPRCPS